MVRGAAETDRRGERSGWDGTGAGPELVQVGGPSAWVTHRRARSGATKGEAARHGAFEGAMQRVT
jgi:hypothetical protein